MIRPWVVVAMLGVALASAGCKSKSKSAKTPDEVVAEPNETSATSAPELFAAAGTDGLIGVAVWPAHWSALRTSCAFMARSGSLAPLAAVESWETPWSAVSVVAGKLSELRIASEAPASFDASRPIVASLLAPMKRYEELALEVAVATRDGKPVAGPGLRHRVILPAVDAAALAGELRAMLATSHAPVAGRPNEFVAKDFWLRLEPGESWVAVDVVTNRSEDQAVPSLAAPSSGSSAAEGVFARPGDSAARLLLRLEKLDELAPYWGMSVVARALGSVEPDYVGLIANEGLSEVLVSTVAIDPTTAVSRGALLEIDTAGAPPSLAALLTEAGAAAFAADPKLAAGKEVALGDLDLLAIAKKAPTPALMEGASLAQVAGFFHRCGFACWIDAGAGNGLALLPMLAEEADDIDELLRVAERTLGVQLGARLEGGLLLVGSRTGNSSMGALEVAAAPTRGETGAAACYASYRRKLMTGLGALSTVDAAQRPQLFARLASELRADRECAAKDAVVAPRIEALDSAVAILGALAAPR